ncbi:restriction endonuclease subunit S, partial [Streptomyces anulatus]
CTTSTSPDRQAVRLVTDHVRTGQRSFTGQVLGARFSRFSESVSGRTGIPKLNRNDLSGYFLHVPPPEVQQGIVDLIDDLTVKEGLEVVRRDKMTALKDALVGELLSGEAFSLLDA